MSREHRLGQLHDGALFTSTLKPKEQALARQLGIQSLGQVMGACFYQVGWQVNAGWTPGELDMVVEALEQVRRRSFQRMWEEARTLGAHAVIGVQIEAKGHEHAGGTLEYVASGTAVRIAGMEPTDSPTLCLLDADELYKCRVAGYWPVGIALGISVAYDQHCDCQNDGAWRNTELMDHNALCAMVEGHASTRFQADAKRLGADGVLGVRMARVGHDHHHDGHTSYKFELMLLGTAVRRVPKIDVKPPLVIVDLGRDAHRQKKAPVEPVEDDH